MPPIRRTPLPALVLMLVLAALACQTLVPAGDDADDNPRRATATPPEDELSVPDGTATLDVSDWLGDDADDADADSDSDTDEAASFDYEAGDAPDFLTLGSGETDVALDEGRLPFLGLFPQLRDAPAPEWLSTGVRVTYRVESASMAQAEEEEGAAGSGYVQNDFVAVADDLVVVSGKLYLDRLDDGVLPYGTFPTLGLPGVGDFWLNPSALTDAEDLAVDDLTVTQDAETFAGEVFDLMRFDYTPEDAHYTWKFDLVSGMLLEYRHDLGGDDDTHRDLAIVTFVRFRQLDLPWAGEPLPAWVCAASHLHYGGRFVTEVGGEPAPGIDYAVAVAFRECTEGWAAYDLTAQLADLPAETVTRVGGADQLFDGLWLPPAAWDALSDGQLLDQDAVIGAEITAHFNADGTLTLYETNTYYQVALTYDTDGWLVALEQQQALGLAVNHVTLTLDDWD